MPKFRIGTFFLLSIFFFMLSNTATPVFAEEAVRIAVFPFKINSDKDLEFLKDGIADMLISRLDRQGKSEIVDRDSIRQAVGKGTLDDRKAAMLGESLEADVLIFGSLTVLGESLSLDAKMVDIRSGRENFSFFEKGAGLDNVIGIVHAFAMQVNEHLWPPTALKTLPRKPTAPSPEKTRKQPVAASPPAAAVHQQTAAEQPTSALIPYEGTKAEKKITRLKSFRQIPNGVAVGDINGDGLNETVVVTANQVIALQYQGVRLLQSAVLFEEPQKKLLAVDIADINQNGFDEIFVSALDFQESSVTSFVAEYNGTQYVKTVQDSSWYYRSVRNKTGQWQLFGQKDATSYHPFNSPIVELAWQNKTYEPDQSVQLPRETSVLGVTTGAIIDQEKKVYLSFNRNDKIQMTDAGSGNRIWLDSEPAGGSSLDFKILKPDTDGPPLFVSQYYPTRLLLHDIDGDAKSELVTVVNMDAAAKFLENRRAFNQFFFKFLTWDGTSWTGKYRSPEGNGFVRDFYIGDYNNDGSNDLVAAAALGNTSTIGSLLGSQGDGYLVVYALPAKP